MITWSRHCPLVLRMILIFTAASNINRQLFVFTLELAKTNDGFLLPRKVEFIYCNITLASLCPQQNMCLPNLVRLLLIDVQIIFLPRQIAAECFCQLRPPLDFSANANNRDIIFVCDEDMITNIIVRVIYNIS